jgi:hypothetical protein
MNTEMLVRACFAIEKVKLEVLALGLKPTEVHFDYETFAELERSLAGVYGLEVEDLCGLRVVPMPTFDCDDPHDCRRGFRLWMPNIYVSQVYELDGVLAK